MKKYFCNINDKFIWFPVPKVATQTIEKTFIASGYELNHSNTQHLPDNFNDVFSFIIVRNPWDRLVSAYRDKIANHWNIKPVSPYRIMEFRPFRGMEFKDFVMSLDSEFIMLENHVKPVVHLAPVKDIKYIGRIETLWEDCEYVFSEIGLEVSELHPAANCTSAWSPGSPFCKYKEYYDNETRDKVAHLYREDIDILKYTFD